MDPQTDSQDEQPSLRVESSAFAMGGVIPLQFTADGDDIAPPLSWSGAPEGTQGYAIIVEDPDAVNADAVSTILAHWIVTGLPASITSLDAGELPDSAVEGTNDHGNRAWNGPNPSVGRHRYFFKVYALDIPIGAPGITRPELLGTIKGHILARGELVGTYERPHEHRSERGGFERERRPSGHRRHLQ